MRFITEMELRDLYKKEPFVEYTLSKETKLTPGARQFLTDRRIPFEAGVRRPKVKSPQGTAQQEGTDAVQPEWRTKKLFRRMEHTESLFLMMAANLSRAGNIILAENVIALGKYLRNARNACKEQKEPAPVQFWGCSASELRNRADAAGQDENALWLDGDGSKGTEVVFLNYLRTAVRDIEPLVWDIQSQGDAAIIWCDGLCSVLQGLADILCIMTGKCMGGQIWKT